MNLPFQTHCFQSLQFSGEVVFLRKCFIVEFTKKSYGNFKKKNFSEKFKGKFSEKK